VARQNIPCDIVYPHSDFSRYQVIVAPALYILPESLAQKLERFVTTGGNLLLTSFSGVTDENGKVWGLPVPAQLNNVFGLEVRDYGNCPETTRPIRLIAKDKRFVFKPIDGLKWIDEVTIFSKKLKTLAFFDHPFFPNLPAVTEHPHRAGKAYYLGTILTQEGYNRFYQTLIRYLNLNPLFPLPEGLYATVRIKDNRRIFFINNPSEQTRSLTLKREYKDLLNDKQVKGGVLLKPVSVLLLLET